jgi:hypothetical protein
VNGFCKLVLVFSTGQDNDYQQSIYYVGSRVKLSLKSAAVAILS